MPLLLLLKLFLELLIFAMRITQLLLQLLDFVLKCLLELLTGILLLIC